MCDLKGRERSLWRNFLATFQVALPVLSAVTGLEALCFVLVGLQPTRKDTFRRVKVPMTHAIGSAAYSSRDRIRYDAQIGAGNLLLHHKQSNSSLMRLELPWRTS